eukprot:Skav204375  [mRNA]  locus=scaffold4897:42516:44048:- [translate_table: standard]
MTELFAKASETSALLLRVLSGGDEARHTLFSVAAQFWPASESKEAMYRRMSDDILKTVCGLNWRILDKQETAPYAFLEVAEKDSVEERILAKTAEFLKVPQCCLDPYWGLPVQRHVRAQDDAATQAETFKQHMVNFVSNSRGVSSREECMHATQRAIAGGFKGKAPAFPKQAAAMVLTESLNNFTARTGVSVGKAPKRIREATKLVRKKQIKHARPKQIGSAMFFYVAAMKKTHPGKSDADLRLQWQNLTPVEKDQWKRKHAVQVAKRRMELSSVQRMEASRPQSKTQSPWGIGSDSLPLKDCFVDDFANVFRTMPTGVEALSQLDFEEIQEYLTAIKEGKKYHSMDAAAMAARSMFGKVVDNANSVQDVWGTVMASTKLRQPCSEKHPGVCQNKDGSMLASIEGLLRLLPKEKSCLLMIQLTRRSAREQLVVYARGILGVELKLKIAETLVLVCRVGSSKRTICGATTYYHCHTANNTVSLYTHYYGVGGIGIGIAVLDLDVAFSGDIV